MNNQKEKRLCRLKNYLRVYKEREKGKMLALICEKGHLVHVVTMDALIREILDRSPTSVRESMPKH